MKIDIGKMSFDEYKEFLYRVVKDSLDLRHEKKDDEKNELLQAKVRYYKNKIKGEKHD